MRNRKLRMGMIGGGPGSFIGNVHRMAANLDGQIELVCGAFSSNPEKSKETGKQLYLPEGRIYGSFQEMIVSESKLTEGEKMDFVSIVTPNHLHFQPAKMALENGFDVVIDKPLAFNLHEAKELVKTVEETDRLFCLTHNYTGYPMVRQARSMVKNGKLGSIRKVVVEYPQGWLSEAIESLGSKQASWRTDPKLAGKTGCVGDIGTHAENLAEYVTGLEIQEIAADLTTFVEGRMLDDDGSVLLHFKGGAKGVLLASQISVGEENNLRIRIYGDQAGLEWSQTEPNSLLIKYPNSPAQIYRAGSGNLYLGEESQKISRLPAGHPEGYLEAFANLYCDFADAWWAKRNGYPLEIKFPTAVDGLRGMKFIEAVVLSQNQNSAWVSL